MDAFEKWFVEADGSVNTDQEKEHLRQAFSAGTEQAFDSIKKRLSELPNEYRKQWEESGKYRQQTIADSWQRFATYMATAVEAIEALERAKEAGE